MVDFENQTAFVRFDNASITPDSMIQVIGALNDGTYTASVQEALLDSSSTLTMTFSKLIQRVPTSSTIKMAQMAREKRQAGKEVINLTLGEPDFPTPDFIVEAGAKALRDGFTKYTPVPGLLSLREAISASFQRKIICRTLRMRSSCRLELSNRLPMQY